MRDPRLKSYDPRASGIVPGGLSGADMALRISGHPEHETGVTPRGKTHRWTGLHDDLGLFTVPQWHKRALCAEPEFSGISFIGDNHRSAGISATTVCARCPVQAECLDEALALEAECRLCYGVRGGLTARQRHALIGAIEEGFVYFGARDGLVKIGTSRISVETRAAAHRFTVLAVEPGSYTRERELHRTFEADRDHGEWFRPSDRLMRYIGSLPTCSRDLLEQVAA